MNQRCRSTLSTLTDKWWKSFLLSIVDVESKRDRRVNTYPLDKLFSFGIFQKKGALCIHKAAGFSSNHNPVSYLNNDLNGSQLERIVVHKGSPIRSENVCGTGVYVL